MDIYIPKDAAATLLSGVNGANNARVAMRAVDAAGHAVQLLEFDRTGFNVEADAPRLRGLVSVHQGTRHVLDCLIVAAQAAPGCIRYEYKRRTEVQAGPALDYVRTRPDIAGLLPGRGA